MAWFNQGATRVYYEEHGRGDPVLLMPGFTASIQELSQLSKALSAKYRVIAADLPGSGRSTPQPRSYTSTYFEDDARTFIALLAELKTGPAHLVGWSDGGEVGLVMAGLKPEIARSVVTWGAKGFMAAGDLPMLEVFGDVVDSPIPPLQEFSNYLKATYGEGNARAMTRSFVTAARAIIQAGGDIGRARAARIACPVLLIAGEEDFMAPPAHVSQLAAVVRKAEVLPLSGAGHDLHRSHAEWLSKTVVAWLAKH